MTPAAYIRRHILGLTQQELAARLDRYQSTVSRWETQGFFPPEIQPQIRELAAVNPEWSDSLFFEVPKQFDASEAA